MKIETFHEHDTTLNLWCVDPKDGRAEEARNIAIKHLRERGFHVRLDINTKRNYRCIAKDHHHARKGDLQVKIDLGGRHLEITFFQNLIHDNPHGGQYDFSKRSKMPYLMGKRYELERNKLAEVMIVFGFPRLQRERVRHGMNWIRYRREELCEFQGDEFYSRPVPDYNSTTAAKGTVRDGDVVYFRDYGRLRKGIAYHNINNMWWVLLPCGTVRNVASFHLFHRGDLTGEPKGRKFDARHSRTRIEKLLADAVKNERFERAAVLRDIKDGMKKETT